MKWLLITDDDNLFCNVNKTLTKADKKNLCLASDFEIKNLLSHKATYKFLTACFIYSENESKFSPKTIAALASICGCLNAQHIPVITNLSIINDNELLEKDFLKKINNEAELINSISKNHKHFIEEAKKRIAKNELFNRGIPFTADCFGTYIAKNKIEIVNEFLQAGMDVNSRDDFGTPMLNIACRNDNFEFVKMLLDLGADLNAISEDRGYTAVMDAVWRGNEKITKYLISKGADLNTINKEGQCNLVLAVGANRESLVKLLTENGADPDVKDTMGMSAYNYAVLFKKQKLIDILQRYHKEA